MNVLRRIVLPTLWLVVAAVIAAALVKIAFFTTEEEGPTAQPGVAIIEGQVTTVEKVDLSSTLKLDGTVEPDPGSPLRATKTGEVNKIWRKKGDVVEEGDRILQVKVEAEPEIIEAPVPSVDGAEGADGTGGQSGTGGEDAPAPAPSEPTYHYFTLRASSSGIISGLEVTEGQQLNTGDTVATLSPGTYSITASLTPEQQLQLLDTTIEATAELPTSEKPITCQDPSISENTEDDEDDTPAVPEGAYDEWGEPLPGSGETSRASLRCPVPEDVRVVPGLKAPITINLGSRDGVLAVPTTAVIGEGKSATVYAPSADGGEPTEIPVELGLRDGELIEVISGLEEGQEILEVAPGVTDPNDGGTDGVEAW